MTDAEWEMAQRDISILARGIDVGVKHFLHAQKISPVVERLAKIGHDMDGQRGMHSREKIKAHEEEYKLNLEAFKREFYHGWGAILDPDVPGVEAIDLGRRDYLHRQTVKLGPQHRLGMFDTDKSLAIREKQHKAREFERTEIAALLQIRKSRLKPEEILSAMDPVRLKKFFINMVEAAERSESVSKMQAVANVILDLFRFTEPKAVLNLDEPIDQLDEDATKDRIRMLANVLREANGDEV
jgi:hypothetical protein